MVIIWELSEGVQGEIVKGLGTWEEDILDVDCVRNCEVLRLDCTG